MGRQGTRWTRYPEVHEGKLLILEVELQKEKQAQ